MAEVNPEQEALRLKSLAEAEFKSSDPKSALKHAKAALRLFPSLPGLSEMVTCFKILAAASASANSGMPDYYGILQVEPFSHINSIRKQYKSLALLIHPDKNASLGTEEAFKVVGDAFRVLSDRIRRKEYDMRLRIRMQEEAARGDGLMDEIAVERFWSACSRCKILHRFEKKYLGHSLVCPNCGKSFRAVEIGDNDKDGDGNWDEEEESSEHDAGNAKMKRKSISADEPKPKRKAGGVDNSKRGSVESHGGKLRKRESEVSRVRDGAEKQVNKNKTAVEEETMTLAEMQLKAVRKMNQEKTMLREKEKEKVLEKEKVAERASGNIGAHDDEAQRLPGSSEIMRCSDLEKTEHLKVYRRGTWRRKSSAVKGIERAEKSNNQNLELMLVEDSDFYDFDKDRSERRFKKGQVWAFYDKVDGMPRNYCLIDEVSLSPFTLKASCLDHQDNVRHPAVKTASTLACGQFKVAQKITLKSVKLLSHVVDCERAARVLYRIYPSKGSVWVLYRNNCYDIVVFLTNYSEVFGLSMAYLMRVDGFKTVFKRQEIGPRAVHQLSKNELGVCSHQIPARRLGGSEVPNFLKDCWELDPASLPPDLLTIPIICSSR